MPDSLEATFLRTVERHRMFGPGDRVVVAVSGGADSTALLHLLTRFGAEHPLEIHVAHLDHGLRGVASASDRRSVEESARQLGLECTSEALTAGPPSGGAGPEADARVARYRFLERVARQVGARRVATGHTRDDQAETVLGNLLRGAGTRGLGGIPPIRGVFVRPLLEAPRSEVERWLREQGISWRDDDSNQDRAFTRNRLRHEVIPSLEREFQPRLRERLAATAEMLRDDEALLEELTGAACEQLVHRGAEGFRVPVGPLARLHPALVRRILRRAWQGEGGRDYPPALRTVEALEALIAGREAGPVDLPGGLRARRSGEDLLVGVPPARTPEGFEERVDVPGQVDWAEAGISLNLQEVDRKALGSDIRHASREIAYLDVDRTGRQLVLRSRQDGDAFYPLGLGGRKKIQDYLVDAHVPREGRGRVGLLTARAEVAWLVGHRIDDRFKVTAETRRVLMVSQEAE